MLQHFNTHSYRTVPYQEADIDFVQGLSQLGPIIVLYGLFQFSVILLSKQNM